MGRGVTSLTAFPHFGLVWVWGRREGEEEDKRRERGLLFLAAYVVHTPGRALRLTEHLGQGDMAYDQRVAGEASLASGHGGHLSKRAAGLGNPFFRLHAC